MALESELSESLKQLDINNHSRESDEDFIKYALQKAVVQKKVFPSIEDSLETKNETMSKIKLQMGIEASEMNISTSLMKICSFLNQAVAYGPPKSEILAKAYVNRSAVLMNVSMYEESLKDVNLAIKAKHPENLIAWMYLRKAKLLIALNKTGEVQECVEKATKYTSKMDKKKQNETLAEINNVVSHVNKYKKWDPAYELKMTEVLPDLFRPEAPQRDNSIFLPTKRSQYSKFTSPSSKIQFKYNKDVGFFIYAKEDIGAGEPLLVNQVYANVINYEERYLRCWNCTKFCWSCVPCKYCANVIFCSDSCRKLAWEAHHDIECKLICVILKHRNVYDKQSLMSLRLFTTALKEYKNIENLQKYIQESETVPSDVEHNSTKYEMIYHMSREPLEKEAKDKLSFAAVYYMYCLAATTELFGKKIANIEELVSHDLALFVGKVLLRHAIIVNTNMIPLKQYTLCKKAKIYGGAIVSLVNLRANDSYPNAYYFFCRDTIALTSMQYIKKGDRIVVSYGPNYLKMLTEERKEIFLKKKDTFWNDYKTSLVDWGSTMAYPPCLNHLKKQTDCNELRDSFQGFAISNLIQWGSKRLEEVPCERLTTTMDKFFQFINDHDQEETQKCIKIEAVKWLLHHIYDFIDSYEL